MAMQPLRGFRDFYPEDQAKITYLRDKIAATCARFGYQEFEGPALEPFDLYAAKSSDEIVNEQAFVFEDKNSDKITLRPELTPTLARMITAKQQQLTFPLRWWSWGRFWRYERPQKGRGREFYQWNCDLIGDDSLAAEIEILSITIAFLESLGLTSDDVMVEINDRAFMNTLLTQNKIPEAKRDAVFKFIDRLPKLETSEQERYAMSLGFTQDEINKLLTLFAQNDLWQQSPTLTNVMDYFTANGKGEWIKPNTAIVRGFTYYTGLVFEVSDCNKQFRALVGGGRYDNLIAAMGGQPLSGIGFAMGDMVILEYLEATQKLPETLLQNPVVTVISFDETTQAYALQCVDTLRQEGIMSIFFAGTGDLGKGLRFANKRPTEWAILVGPNELKTKTITLKNLASGEQETIHQDQALQKLKV